MGRTLGWIAVVVVAIILLVLTFGPRVVHEAPPAGSGAAVEQNTPPR